ncbi:hypothetical protein WJX79_002161 [Trebouxia sp. C0005]|nr:MAG: hypothetical protein FRX49_04576 [Trebouxia sp. A1-2]
MESTSFRQIVDIDLRWSEDSPMKLCFDNPDNEEYQSEWHPLQPPLPGATLLAQNVLDYDIIPSEDKITRWSHDAQVKDDGSAVRAIIRRRYGTVPSGLLLRVVVDNVHTQMAPLMQYVRQMEADKIALQARLERQIHLNYNAHNPLQVWNCDLHGMTIGDGTAQKMLDQKWATVNGMAADNNQDFKFRVICGAGSHNNGPAPMKKFVRDWFIGKQVPYTTEANETVFFHVIHARNRAN